MRPSTMKFINLTPHSMTFRADVTNTVAAPAEGDIIVAPRLGEDGKPAPARVSSTPGVQVGEASGIPVFGAPTWGSVEGLPEDADEGTTLIIVSLQVLERLRALGSTRTDIVGPGTGPQDGAIRFGEEAGPRKGQVFAVTRLNRL